MKAFNTIRYINIFVVASFILVSAVTYLYPPGLIAIALLILVILAVWLVIRRPIRAVYFLVIYMPFENLVLKFLPGSAQVYLAASFASEILIYFTFSVVLLKHLLQKPTVQVTPIDPILIIFVIISLTSIFINQAPCWEV